MKKFRHLEITAALILGLVMTGCVQKRTPGPPTAKAVPKSDTLHGDIRVDPYAWLKDRENPDVIRYLEAENDYTESVMMPTVRFQKRLYREMLSRIKETDLTVPVEEDGYFYYSRTEEGKQYPIHCRKAGTLEAPEQVLLDENRLAKGEDYFHVGAYSVSPDHRLLAYSTDTEGSELFRLVIKNLDSGDLLPDVITNSYYHVEWANDNETIFYTVQDEAKRPHQVFRHRLGTSQSEDRLIYHEPDEKFRVSLSKTKDEEFILLNIRSETTTEVRFLSADESLGEFTVVHPRQHEMEYDVAHHGDRFFIRTNDQAKNFRIMVARDDDPSKENWTEFILHRKPVKIDGMDVFAGHLALYEREKGLRKIEILVLETGEIHDVKFPEPVYAAWPGDNPSFESNVLRFHYTSMVTPRSVYDYDMVTRDRTLMKQVEVLGDYDPSEYRSERIFARAEDGTEIPISLMVRKDFVRDGSHPLLLYGYGSYGASIDPSFSSNRLSLVDRGFAYAIAHVRGGGEMGREWYDQGKMLNKTNTFTDFIACAEHLLAAGYTSPERLVISGGSAGGLLMGAVTNMRPDLFSVVVATVPFVDVLNTMLDPDIPLTVIEYEEWGDPNLKEYYDYMKSYSPYDNVKVGDYPHMLITAGLNDPRVQYWEPAKWTAKLRAAKTDSNILLLKTEMGAGHFGPSGRYEYLKEVAFQYAFILNRLGMTDEP